MVDGDSDLLLVLLNGFDLNCQGHRIHSPLGTQRLMAYLAFHHSSNRSRTAEILWPNSSPSHAAGNLRTAIWRGRKLGSRPAIECSGQYLRLNPMIRVDVIDFCNRMLPAGDDYPVDPNLDAVIAGLSSELLPEWTDDWLMIERQQWDQERLHALDFLAHRLLMARQYLLALKAALTAITIEPIRETPHRTVMAIHAAEGNDASAHMHYLNYCELLDRELGVRPSRQMAELVERLSSGAEFSRVDAASCGKAEVDEDMAGVTAVSRLTSR
jgi:DNA-binding SARP family transcriptional activator